MLSRCFQLAIPLKRCMFRNLHLMFWNEERRLGYEVTSLSSPTNGTGFPLLHYIGQHGEELHEAQDQKHKGNAPNPRYLRTHWASHSSPLSPTPLPASISNDMDQELHRALSKACITSSNFPIHFRPQPEFLLWKSVGKAQRGTSQGLVSVFLFYLSLQQHTHPWLLAVSLSSSHWTASHLSSSYGFSFCPHFIYFMCSAGKLLSWTSVYKSWRARL